jgi:hypothetical protein
MQIARGAFILAVAVIAAAAGYAALRIALAPRLGSDGTAWNEVAWPFPSEPWGRGRAFRCEAAACGSEIDLYLRVKIGFCNCSAAIDDEEIDRVTDFDFVGGERSALGPGKPIGMHGMNGRSRRYTLAGHGVKARPVLALAFHDRCDMVVAIAVSGDEPAIPEDSVIAFLSGAEAWHWVEVALGL